MQAVNKYVIVQVIKEEVKTESGLLLTANEAEKFRYKKARVINPGTNVDTVKEGDTIYFDKSSGHTVVLNNNKYTIILERDVVVII